MIDEPLLKVDSIDVAYGDVSVLREVTLDVGKGEIVAVIGPNAAGKSTLLSAIMGYRHPTSGSIAFDGSTVDRMPPEQIVRLGMTIVPEGARVFRDMTVLDNLKMGSYLKAARADREKNLEMVYEFFPRLKERMQQKGGTLSGGERQMLAIGRALMSGPRLLLLDEPSLGLAPLLVTRVFSAVKDIAGTGLTVLLVEQNFHHALQVASRAYVLENGRVVLEGSGAELAKNIHVKRAYLAL